MRSSMAGSRWRDFGHDGRRRRSRPTAVATGNSAVEVPSASASDACTDATAAPRRRDSATEIGEGVSGQCRRHRPALLGPGGELGDHPQRARLAVPGGVEGGQQPRDVLVAGAAKDAVEFDVGIDAGTDPAERLHDRLLAEHDAGVALFGTRHLGRGSSDRQRRSPGSLVNDTAPRVAGVLAQRHQEGRRRRVEQRVVTDATVGDADRRAVPVAGVGVRLRRRFVTDSHLTITW